MLPECGGPPKQRLKKPHHLGKISDAYLSGELFDLRPGLQRCGNLIGAGVGDLRGGVLSDSVDETFQDSSWATTVAWSGRFINSASLTHQRPHPADVLPD